METISDDNIKAVLEALSDCSSETIRLVRPLLHLPVVQHMLRVFLMDQSRSFEDWILDPQCQHRLWHLKERIGSHDVPAMTANYEEQLALVMQRRLRASPSSPGVVHVGTSSVPGNKISSNHAQVLEFGESGVDKDADGGDADGGRDEPHLPSPQVGSSEQAGSWPYSGGGGGGALQETEAVCLPQGQDDCEMLLVMSEAMKADARRKFEKGDFMGAARTYRAAAFSLDERQPPSSASAEPLRKRLRDLYVKCMCNAAIAGFKAAVAAPSPGEAHGLVVDACTRALERSDGCCPKASFWRARVKMSQHMYEAAEADLVKAVADEENEVRSKFASVRNLDRGKTGVKVKVKVKDDATESHCDGDSVEVPQQDPGDVGSRTSPREVGKEPERHSKGKGSQGRWGGDCAVGKEVGCSGEVSNTSGAPGKAESNGHSTNININVTETEPETVFHGPRLKDAETCTARAPERERVPSKKSPSNGLSEAARWLARVRAKIAKVDAARALAAKQSFERDERITAARKLAGKKALEWRRHGPGHVSPRSSGEAQASESGVESSGSAGEDQGGWEQDQCRGDESGEGSPAKTRLGDGSNGAGWRVPKPPLLNSPGKNPATVLNDYALHARFQAVPSYEQVKGENGRPEYICTLSVGPGDRIVGNGQGTNLKAAKRNASVDFLTNAAIAWNEENPCDAIDMAKMLAPPQEPPKKELVVEPDITDEFKAYVEAWVELVALDKVQEAAFPIEISRLQRKHVHDIVESRGDERLLSKSCTIKGRRRLSVMRKEMMEGLAYTSGGNVIVVDIPNVNILPSEVGDMGTITRPPPEPILANMNKARMAVSAS